MEKTFKSRELFKLRNGYKDPHVAAFLDRNGCTTCFSARTLTETAHEQCIQLRTDSETRVPVFPVHEVQ